MTDYVMSGGRSPFYPLPGQSQGGHIIGSRATFFLPANFSGPSANDLAIPNLTISMVTSSPVTMPANFFGMHIQKRANDSQVAYQFKTVRSHDFFGGTSRWLSIQPTSSTDTTTWNWTDVDSWVNTHYAAGRDIVFVLFGTPTWASARPTENNAYGVLGAAAEPSSMTTWSYYCAQVATRYAGKIKYYEVWNEPNYHNNGTGPGAYTDCFFTGTWATLSQMVRLANQAIKAVDSSAKIICPPVQGWLPTPDLSNTYFTSMMSASDGAGGTMKDWVDIIGVHLYLNNNRVQDLPGQIDQVKACMATAGVSGKELWDTESAPWQASTLPNVIFNRILQRMWIIMAAMGVARTIYYQWDHGTMGISLVPSLVSNAVATRALLMSATMLNTSRFVDGRVAYWTAGGVVII